MSFAIRWREDASGFVGPHAGKLASSPPHFDTPEAAEEVRRGMPNGDHAEVIEVAEKAGEWVLDEDARARIDAEYERIERLQADLPRCVVCGQRCTRLAKDGTCSKVSERSEPHRAYRAEVKAGVRA
jgi:hypothetical protein